MLAKRVLIYEAGLTIRRGGGQGCITLSLYLPGFVPLILDSLHLCALAPLDLPDRKDLFLKITVEALVVRMATVFKRLLNPSDYII